MWEESESDMEKPRLRRVAVAMFWVAAATLLITSCPNPAAPDQTAVVYANGYSMNSSGVMVGGYWKNGTWIDLMPLDAAKSSVVGSIVVSGSDIYAGGTCYNSSDVKVPGYWKNGVWTGLAPLDTTKDASAGIAAVVE
jgi:hypothetical protein